MRPAKKASLTEKAEVAGELDAGPGVTVQLVGSLQAGLEALGFGRTHSFVRIECGDVVTGSFGYSQGSQ